MENVISLLLARVWTKPCPPIDPDYRLLLLPLFTKSTICLRLLVSPARCTFFGNWLLKTRSVTGVLMWKPTGEGETSLLSCVYSVIYICARSYLRSTPDCMEALIRSGSWVTWDMLKSADAVYWAVC